MSKQGKGKMRRPIWPLTFAPLVALCIVILTTTVDTPVAQAVVETSADRDQLTLMFQTAVTPTVPSIVLPRLAPSATATVDASAAITVSDTTAVSDTAIVSATGALSDTATLSATLLMTVTVPATVTSTVTPAVTSTVAVSTEQQVLDAEYAGPIEGTIIANRTEANIRFFVEGATYELAPLRSIGLSLPRVTAVLNLFNCDAALPETQEGCFWDPYLLNRDSFYEIVSGETTGEAAALTLQAAGTPPKNQVWLQNRTGKREQVFYGGETYELPPAAVQEFTTAVDTPAIFYLRSCLEATDRTVCEWAPNDATPGYYYALIEVNVNGAVPDSRVNALALQPIVSDEGSVPVESVTPAAANPTQVLCRVQVPALNVRSGPGLQYQIISKVRSSEQEPTTVLVIGRDADGQWLAVADTVAPGGWVTGSSGFVTCTGEVNTLPLAEVTDGRLAPTPVASAPAASAETTTSSDESPDVSVEATPAEEAPIAETAPITVPQAAPPGQSLIVVHNGFEQQIRFTLDQRYRIAVGPSEFDLQPGEAVSLLVYPGMVTFSASTPWRGISGNDDFVIEEQQTRDLWITFVPDPDGSGQWLLQF